VIRCFTVSGAFLASGHRYCNAYKVVIIKQLCTYIICKVKGRKLPQIEENITEKRLILCRHIALVWINFMFYKLQNCDAVSHCGCI